MTVPNSAFLNDNMNDSDIWAILGLPTPVDDAWNPLAAINYDGVDDKNTNKGSEILTTGSTATISLWVNTTDNSALVSLMNERDVVAANGFYIRLLGGTIQAAFTPDGSNFRRSTSSTTVNDGVDHHIRVVLRSLSDVDIFVDDDEVTYAAAEHDRLGGTGFPGHTVAGTKLLIGGNTAGTVPYIGLATRPRIWTQALSISQGTEDYDNELAAKGEGFPAVGDLNGSLHLNKSLYL